MIVKTKAFLSVITFAALTTFGLGHGDHHHHHDHHHHDHDHDHGSLRALQGNGNGNNKWKDVDFCGTRKPDEAQQASDHEVVKKWKEKNKDKINNGNRALQAIDVDVHMHLVYPAGGRDKNDIIKNNNAQAQVDILNTAFQGMFNFNLVQPVLEHENSNWWNINAGSSQERDMKRKTRQGDCSALNLWYTDLSSGLLGWATFPSWCAGDMDDDGVVNLHSSGILGSASPYNEGDTNTHEVGHWLGLYHTFQGGCNGQGDQVDDTPPEREPAYDCRERDTCRKDNQNDPIRNFMDYTTDACMDHFTPLQFNRMEAMWYAYRSTTPPTDSPPPPSPPTTSACSASCECGCNGGGKCIKNCGNKNKLW